MKRMNQLVWYIVKSSFQATYLGNPHALYELTPGCLLYAAANSSFNEESRMPSALCEEGGEMLTFRNIACMPLLWGPFSEQQMKERLWYVGGELGPTVADLNLYQAGKQRRRKMLDNDRAALLSAKFFNALIGESCMHLVFEHDYIARFELVTPLEPAEFLIEE